MCLCVYNFIIIVFYYYFGMNFAFIKKMTAFGVASVLLASGFLSSSVLAENTEPTTETQEIHKGTGGSNPLVVARLRAEGLARQAELKKQEALQNTKPEVSTVTKSTNSRYAQQELPEYIPDFKTIGDVAKELTAVVSEEEITNKTEELTNTITSEKFTTQFSDINDSEEKESIVILDALNIVSGRENTQFKPNEIITRKEAIKISTLVSGKSVSPQKASSVADIDDSDWSVPYVEKVLDDKIIYLDSEEKLEGDSPVTVDEAFALYLLNSGVCINANEEDFPFYSAFKSEYSSDIEITDYTTDLVEGDEITREDFAKISVQVLNALSIHADYSPANQLQGEQYSASQVSQDTERAVVKRELLNVLFGEISK